MPLGTTNPPSRCGGGGGVGSGGGGGGGDGRHLMEGAQFPSIIALVVTYRYEYIHTYRQTDKHK